MNRLHLLLAAALTCAVPATAQQPNAGAPPPPQQQSGDEIVVEARRKALETTIKQIFAPSTSGQLARFETEICPHVFGLPADWKAVVTDTIRENIKAAGGTVGKPGCGANAIVIFIYEPQELVQALGRAMPELFNMDPQMIRKLGGTARAVTSWHASDTKSRDGKPLEKVRGMTVDGLEVPGDFYVANNSSATRMYSNVREDMRLGFVVMDAQQIHGKGLRQIADLATMHLMLDVKVDAGAQDASSILSLFDPRPAGGEPPRRMSAVDRAVLGGFYGIRSNNLTQTQARQQIRRAASRKLREDR